MRVSCIFHLTASFEYRLVCIKFQKTGFGDSVNPSNPVGESGYSCNRSNN